MFGLNTTKSKAIRQDAFWLEPSLKLGQISNGHKYIKAIKGVSDRFNWSLGVKLSKLINLEGSKMS